MAGAVSVGAAVSLVAVVRLTGRAVFLVNTQWMNAVYLLATILVCVFLFACAWCYRDPRVLLCVPCLWGVVFLQARELDQQALHQHGRTEHVRVQQIQWLPGDGMDPGNYRYTVTVLDGPPLKPFQDSGPKPWNWTIGGTYTVTVDPQQRARLSPGGRPGPPEIPQLLQIPLGLGLTYALWRPARLLLRRKGVPSAQLRGGA